MTARTRKVEAAAAKRPVALYAYRATLEYPWWHDKHAEDARAWWRTVKEYGRE